MSPLAFPAHVTPTIPTSRPAGEPSDSPAYRWRSGGRRLSSSTAARSRPARTSPVHPRCASSSLWAARLSRSRRRAARTREPARPRAPTESHHPPRQHGRRAGSTRPRQRRRRDHRQLLGPVARGVHHLHAIPPRPDVDVTGCGVGMPRKCLERASMPALPLISGGTSLSAASAVRHGHARGAAGDPHLYGCRGGHPRSGSSRESDRVGHQRQARRPRCRTGGVRGRRRRRHRRRDQVPGRLASGDVATSPTIRGLSRGRM
jgi:hypothetical protein